MTHPVDLRPDVLVDRHVRPSLELVVRRKPRREGRVGEDELAFGQRLAQGLGERRHPLLRSAVALVHRRQVLVVDVDPVKAVRLDECRHRVRGPDGVCVGGGWGVGGAECGCDDFDACLCVLVLLCGLCGCGEGCPVACLVDRTLESEE